MEKKLQLLVLFFVVALGFSACKSKKKVTEFPNAQKEAVAEVEEKVEEEVRHEKFSLDPRETNSDVLKKKFHVVVGSFGNKDNAQGLKNELNEEGNQATIVINEKGMYRVLLASYDEYRDARYKIADVSKRFPDAWVLRQKR